MVGTHGFWTVWRYHTAILPHASGDGQTGLVSHGFRKRQLGWTDEGQGGNGEIAERRFGFKDILKRTGPAQKMQTATFTQSMHESRSNVHAPTHSLYIQLERVQSHSQYCVLILFCVLIFLIFALFKKCCVS